MRRRRVRAARDARYRTTASRHLSQDLLLWLTLFGPAFSGLALTGLRPMRAYLVTALAGALGLAVVAAIDNEVTNYDNAPGVILVLTFLYGVGLALPGILVAGITRWAFTALRSE